MADDIDEQLTSELAYLSDAPQDQESQGVYFDFDTDEGAHFDFDTEALGQALDEVPHPGQAEPPTSTSVSQGVRMSGSGFGPDTGQGELWRKGYEQFAQNDARISASRDLAVDQSTAAYDQAGAALDLEAGIKAESERSKAELLQDQEDFLRDMAELDKTMYAQARAESEQYLNAYQQQIAAVRQMSVVNPVQTLGGMEAAGLSMAMFAQGFLAAQGIQIDVTGQVDRWIDRSIEEQQRRIGQAAAGAEDQLNLWRISQETSRNDLEARTRYRGMVLEAMTTAIDINAARFGAPLARSAAEVAKAKIEIEKAGVARSIRDGYEQERRENLKAMRDEVHKRVEERHRAWGLSIAEKEAEARKKAAEAKGKAPNLIVDSRNVIRDKDGNIVSGGRVVGELSHDAPTETQKAVIGKKQLNDSVQSGMDELRRLYKDLDGEFGPGWFRKRSSEAYAIFDAERTRLVGEIQRNFTGLAATDKEAERWLSQLADDKLIQAGPDRLPKLMDGMSAWARRSFEQSLDLPGVIKYSPKDQYNEERLDLDPEGSALDEARKRHAPAISGVGKAAGDAVTRDDELVEGQSAFYKKYHGASEAKPGGGFSKVKEAVKGGGSEGWARDLEMLARTAIDPSAQYEANASQYRQYGAKVPGLSAEELKQRADQAHTALIDIAAGKSLEEAANEEMADLGVSSSVGFSEGLSSTSRAKYARALLDELNRNPKKLLEQLQ